MSKRLTAWWSLLREAHRNFQAHAGPMMAAGASFYAMLSLVPLALLATSLFGHLLGSHHQGEVRVAELVRAVLPGVSSPVLGALEAIRGKQSRWLADAAGMLVLLWSGMRLFEHLAGALSRIWWGSPKFGFFKHKLVALAGVIAAELLFLLYVVFTGLVAAVRRHPSGLESAARYLAVLSPLAHWVVATTVVAALFFLAYRYLPAGAVSWRAALPAALLAAACWQLSRLLFLTLVVGSAHYGELYGPLAGVVVLLLWVYFLASLLFFCAEIGAAIERKRARAREAEDRC